MHSVKAGFSCRQKVICAVRSQSLSIVKIIDLVAAGTVCKLKPGCAAHILLNAAPGLASYSPACHCIEREAEDAGTHGCDRLDELKFALNEQLSALHHTPHRPN